MGKIYEDKSFRLTLETGIDVSAATAVKIYYKKPSDTAFTALTATASGTTVYYDITTELSEPGSYELYATATISGVTYEGETAYLEIYER